MKTIKKVKSTNTPLMDTLFRLNFNKDYHMLIKGDLLALEDDLNRLVEEEIRRRGVVKTRVIA